ncbi:hypothetical protein LOTGIDRAFT_169139 [Lottia gigantea]|uniref:Uncharacterized protein n=1 Tax=Lottia gigantea TaxID=225164 RepID=V3YZM7_LOTGI|nr:hypothetical protein LOTGIDRAFT_169139 [Lottia gigantea]ESO83663.1 hypothetical protein LOTGIDRAFT_169139 [Lottia gigantea]
MKVNFVFALFFVWFIASLAQQNDTTEELVVPPITSLTMCLARSSFLKNGFGFSLNSPATEREHSSKKRKRRQARCPLTTPYYRSADGECNNLRYPNWGRSFEKFKRFLPPHYDDGISIPRLRGTCRNDLSMFGCFRSQLPSPRLIGVEIHRPDPNPTTSIHSVMLMQWGQFLDHDLTAAAIEQPVDLTTCCSESGASIGRYHADTFRRRGMCFTISMFQTTKDRFFESQCMDFIRSRPVNPEMSVRKPREQQNLLSAFIDASNVYGSDQGTQDRLRGPDGKYFTGSNPHIETSGAFRHFMTNGVWFLHAASCEIDLSAKTQT